MEELVVMLKEIYAILEQINAITTNQTTVLLQSREQTQSQNEMLDIIEGMVDYKDELITKVSQTEQLFENTYKHINRSTIDPSYAKVFKEWVGKILNMKETIAEAERNNVLVMQSLMNLHQKKLEIPKTANAVVEAYKKQQVKS